MVYSVGNKLITTPVGTEIVAVDNGNAALTAVTLNTISNPANASIVAAAKSVTSSTTLVATGLSANLQAGGTYTFEAYLSVTNGASGGLDLTSDGGTATATTYCADAWAYNTTTLAAQGNVTALASSLVADTAAITVVFVTGTIVVSAGGTFALRFSQNASNGTATTINAGSYLNVRRLS